MDDKGYVKVTDFGISCEVEARNFKDTSGTPGYMAP
jgi:serine/threonine protein kinase